MFNINRLGPPSVTGTSIGETCGYYTRDAHVSTRCLFFDVILIHFTSISPILSNLNQLNHLIMPKVRFEVRPDIPYTLIGSNIWNGSPLSIPKYNQMIRLGSSNKIVYRKQKSYVLSRLRIALWNKCFTWKNHLPQVWAGIAPNLPANKCLLGRDFLEKGILIWDKNYTHFYPQYETRQIWYKKSNNNFSLPDKTPL